MSTRCIRNNILKIPGHWTEAQADAVFEFVNELAAAVFNAYEKEFVASEIREITLEEMDDDHGLLKENEYDDDIFPG
ncbi:MAG: hypothetical protein QNJ97_27020 [Myxococcota bacterium]|nr:hypothetical protein [Myxococcota bacterium]